MEWLNDALPPNPDTDVAASPFLRALISYADADAVASRFAVGEEPPTLERVFNQIARFHQSQGAYQEALRLRNASLDIPRRIYGDGHGETAISLANLARTYSALGGMRRRCRWRSGRWR